MRRVTYIGRGSNVEYEAEETHGAKRGGRRKLKRGGYVPDIKPRLRADRMSRGTAASGGGAKRGGRAHDGEHMLALVFRMPPYRPG